MPVETFRRPLTAAERAALENPPPPGGRAYWTARWVVVIAVGAVFGVAATVPVFWLLQWLLGRIPPWLIVPLWVAGAAFGGLYGAFVWYPRLAADDLRRATAWREERQPALEQGEMEVTRVTGVRGGVDCPLQDYVDFYLFDVDGTHTLTLISNHPVRRLPPDFPAREMDLLRYPGVSEIIRVECRGDGVPLRRAGVAAVRKDVLGYDYGDGTLVPVPLVAVLTEEGR